MQTTIELDTDEINQDYQYLHAHGETAFKETVTTNYLAKRLDEMGVSYIRFDDFPGLIATIGDGSRPLIGVRSDIDALKQEYQGQVGVHHSCGHDAHMAIVLQVAKYFAANPEAFKGTLKLIFQPAEETVTGAEAVIKSGKLPKLDYLYGLHVTAKDELSMGQAEPMIPDIATRTYFMTITGKTAHAGRPWLGSNVIDAFSDLNERFRNIKLDTDTPYSIITTMFQAGESSNIVPDKGTFAVDLRTKTNELMDDMQAKAFAAIDAVQGGDIKITMNENDLSPAAIPSEIAMKNMTQAITNVLGEDGLVQPVPTQGGDDFHFYAYDGVAKETTMLGLGCDLTPGLHVPGMTFDKRAIVSGAQIMINAIQLT